MFAPTKIVAFHSSDPRIQSLPWEPAPPRSGWAHATCGLCSEHPAVLRERIFLLVVRCLRHFTFHSVRIIFLLTASCSEAFQLSRC